MKKTVMPTSIGSELVGVFFVFCSLIILIGTSSAGPILGQSPQNMINEYYSGFNSPLSIGFEYVKPQISRSPLSFAGSFRPKSGLDALREAQAKESSTETEDIEMEGLVSQENIQDLKALNTKMERNIIYDDWQSGSPLNNGIENFMDIMINSDRKMDAADDAWPFDNITGRVAAKADRSTQVYGNWPLRGQELKGYVNYMNIEVRDITVTATNTVSGGSAVATSNIIIKPVQQIICPSEVEEKLK